MRYFYWIALCVHFANLVWLQGSFPLAEGQRWKWGRMVLKAVFCFLTAKWIKSTLDRGEGGVWVTPHCSEALVFASLICTSVTEKNIQDFKSCLITFLQTNEWLFWSLPSSYWSHLSFSCEVTFTGRHSSTFPNLRLGQRPNQGCSKDWNQTLGSDLCLITWYHSMASSAHSASLLNKQYGERRFF